MYRRLTDQTNKWCLSGWSHLLPLETPLLNIWGELLLSSYVSKKMVSIAIICTFAFNNWLTSNYLWTESRTSLHSLKGLGQLAITEISQREVQATTQREEKTINSLAEKKAVSFISTSAEHGLTFWLFVLYCGSCCCDPYITAVMNTSLSFHRYVRKSLLVTGA